MAPRKKRKKKYHGFWVVIRIQVILIILVLGALAYYFFGGYAKQVQKLSADAKNFVENSTKDTFCASQTSIVYDAGGNQISTLKGEKDVYYLESNKIPEYAKQAVVSIEDKKFYQHHGIDYQAIMRAVFAMVRNGEVKQGGSTITQQLSRTVFLTQEKTWQRKMEEIFIATGLEKKFTKNQILEFYLNNIYFGNGYYGIGAASKGYFDMDVKNLDLAQLTFLCAIPNNPTLYDPVKNPANTLKRRNRILDQMLADGKISGAVCRIAKSEEITLNRPASQKNDYVETYSYYCATKALMEIRGFKFQTVFKTDDEKNTYQKSYDEMYQDCEKSLYTGGYRIYTSIDLSMQDMLQGAVDNHLAGLTEVNNEGIYDFQGAAVTIDNATGYVKAVVGGRKQDYNGYTLNRAFQSFRQPGSAIKPLIVYTPMLERGYTADSVLTDEPIEGGPTNSNGRYEGHVTLRHAVEESINTVAWNLFGQLTPAVGISYLEQMNFSKLSGEDTRLSSALGGFEKGVSPVEMASAYAALENDGKFRQPTCIVKITDTDGKNIYQSKEEEIPVYKENASRMMTDILTGVLTRGTAAGLALDSTASAGKTGTTNSNKDGWFVGYTKYYTTAVWVGYDMPKELPGLTGAGYPAAIWNDYMTQLHTNLPNAEFVAAVGTDTGQ